MPHFDFALLVIDNCLCACFACASMIILYFRVVHQSRPHPGESSHSLIIRRLNEVRMSVDSRDSASPSISDSTCTSPPPAKVEEEHEDKVGSVVSHSFSLLIIVRIVTRET